MKIKHTIKQEFCLSKLESQLTIGWEFYLFELESRLTIGREFQIFNLYIFGYSMEPLIYGTLFWIFLINKWFEQIFLFLDGLFVQWKITRGVLFFWGVSGRSSLLWTIMNTDYCVEKNCPEWCMFFIFWNLHVGRD